jgi:hypothetical protein
MSTPSVYSTLHLSPSHHLSLLTSHKHPHHNNMSRYLSIFITVLSLAQVQAWTVPILGVGTSPPPSFLLTTDISPQCAAVNKGTYLCCEASVNGGNAAVQLAANLAGYELPANTVNGVLCEYSSLCSLLVLF